MVGKDYIDRYSLIKKVHTGMNIIEAMQAIIDAPAADVVEARNGKWIEENTRPRSSQFCCSVCHRTAHDPQPTRVKDWKKRCRYAYCPNCGARNIP